MKNKRRTPAYIMTLILIFSLIGCSTSQKPVSPVSPASDVTKISDTTLTFKTYSNARFGFSLSYPDIYTKKTESDNGDGISMESSDKLHTLKIWGGYNVNNSSGVDLMNMAKKRVSHIIHEYADDHVYKLEYGGGDDTPIIFNEVSCVTGDQLFGFIISYPEKEKGGYADIVTKMTNELNNSKPIIVGAGSKHTWNFKGVKQGTTKISFKYYRSWEGEKSATKTSEYTIKIIE